MNQFLYVQSCRRINYHDDIVLRTPTVSIKERMLDVLFKNKSLDGNCILEVKYPNCEKDIQEIMEDLRLNADRIILAIQTEKCLNDLIGVQRDHSNTEYIREDSLQSWHTRTISNCNLVELPHSVSDLLIKSDNRVFNFLEAMNTNNLRKEIETCLPITFQF